MNGSRQISDETEWQPRLWNNSSAMWKDDQPKNWYFTHDAFHRRIDAGNWFCWLVRKLTASGRNWEKNNGTVPLRSWPSKNTGRAVTPPRQCVREVIYVFGMCLNLYVQKWQTFYKFSFMFHYNKAEYSMKHSVLSAIPLWCHKGWINLKGSWTIACSLVSVQITNFFVECCKDIVETFWTADMATLLGEGQKKIGTNFFNLLKPFAFHITNLLWAGKSWILASERPDNNLPRG